jgi:hypothetical protein
MATLLAASGPGLMACVHGSVGRGGDASGGSRWQVYRGDQVSGAADHG